MKPHKEKRNQKTVYLNDPAWERLDKLIDKRKQSGSDIINQLILKEPLKGVK